MNVSMSVRSAAGSVSHAARFCAGGKSVPRGRFVSNSILSASIMSPPGNYANHGRNFFAIAAIIGPRKKPVTIDTTPTVLPSSQPMAIADRS